ncbi:hypothetical protein B0H67DRAFT_330083 [Lasiosphaeris hirsuta]|uniref:Uncharacterized protein n=1 Tax=Lasiosphaeris hirsuta TaxID=260670 RepID=A0AA40DLJ2_9PEZI|nr:hypothetical protein B0H67DRAFT_330083 [Lasiosphaeris hirsuta]
MTLSTPSTHVHSLKSPCQVLSQTQSFSRTYLILLGAPPQISQLYPTTTLQIGMPGFHSPKPILPPVSRVLLLLTDLVLPGSASCKCSYTRCCVCWCSASCAPAPVVVSVGMRGAADGSRRGCRAYLLICLSTYPLIRLSAYPLIRLSACPLACGCACSRLETCSGSIDSTGFKWRCHGGALPCLKLYCVIGHCCSCLRCAWSDWVWHISPSVQVPILYIKFKVRTYSNVVYIIRMPRFKSLKASDQDSHTGFNKSLEPQIVNIALLSPHSIEAKALQVGSQGAS